ncbi:unnamed protein product [Prorocentrum cordatum]|uniref:Uncharacterized protein n=1 Tax=Prorocentrum cordatum TaxID=2364126 RepID=A0ABN9U901_9DINO|nr:unnamed protein product [Polarella glacialis]
MINHQKRQPPTSSCPKPVTGRDLSEGAEKQRKAEREGSGEGCSMRGPRSPDPLPGRSFCRPGATLDGTGPHRWPQGPEPRRSARRDKVRAQGEGRAAEATKAKGHSRVPPKVERALRRPAARAARARPSEPRARSRCAPSGIHAAPGANAGGEGGPRIGAPKSSVI